MKLNRIVLALFAVCWANSSVYSQTSRSFVGGFTDWQNTGNWSPSGYATNDNLTIASTFTQTTGAGVLATGNGSITYNSGAVVAHNSGDVTATTRFVLAGNSTATVNAGATVTVGARRVLVGGQSGNATSSLIINGGTFNHTSDGGNNFYVGASYAGGSNNHGTVTLISGNLNIGNQIQVGQGGGTNTGTINVQGGTFTKTGGGNFFIGDNSPAHFNVSGGTVNVNTGNTLIGGVGTNGQGTFNMTGGQYNVNATSGRFVFGQGGGRGTGFMSGGTMTGVGASSLFIVGTDAIGGAPRGQFTMNGGVLDFDNSSGSAVIVGAFSGDGLFTFNDGTINATSLQLGTSFSSTTSRGTFIMNGGTLNAGNAIDVGMTGSATRLGTFIMNGGTASAASLLAQDATDIVRLEGGTMRVNTINRNNSATFNWGSATLTAFSSAAEGVIDRSLGPPNNPVYEGRIIKMNGNLTTGSGTGQNSVLDLGSTFINSGFRYNQLQVTGALNLSSLSDSLLLEMNPYFLRPSSPSSVITGDWGTMVLVDATSLSGVFTSFTGIGSDAIGFSMASGSGGIDTMINPATLDMNTWYLEYRTSTGDVLLHYKIQGTVPEPGTFGLIALGGMLLHRLRRKAA